MLIVTFQWRFAVILTGWPVLVTSYSDAPTTRLVCSTKIGVAKADRILNGGFEITLLAVVLTEWPVLFTTPAVLFSQHPIATRSGLRGPNGPQGSRGLNTRHAGLRLMCWFSVISIKGSAYRQIQCVGGRVFRDEDILRCGVGRVLIPVTPREVESFVTKIYRDGLELSAVSVPQVRSLGPSSATDL